MINDPFIYFIQQISIERALYDGTLIDGVIIPVHSLYLLWMFMHFTKDIPIMYIYNILNKQQ